MEHIAIDTDEETVVEKSQVRVSIFWKRRPFPGAGVCFFEGPDGVQLEFIEMKK